MTGERALYPPPTKWTISTRSPSESFTSGHSARRTTSLLSSMARRSGASESCSTSESRVVPSSTSFVSPLSLICKAAPLRLVDDPSHLDRVVSVCGAYDDGRATGVEARQQRAHDGDAPLVGLCRLYHRPEGRAQNFDHHGRVGHGPLPVSPAPDVNLDGRQLTGAEVALVVEEAEVEFVRGVVRQFCSLFLLRLRFVEQLLFDRNLAVNRPGRNEGRRR